MAREEIRLRAEIGFGGYYRPGRWTFARVTLENRSSQAAELDVTVLGKSPGAQFRSRAHFSMGPGPIAKKTRFMYLRPSLDLTGAKVFVQGKGERARLVDEPRLPGAVALLVGVASERPGAGALRIQAAYRDRGLDKAKAVHVPLDHLPDRRIGLDALHALYLPEAGVGLRAAQAEAIAGWVAAGGELVLSGGGAVSELVSSPLSGLFPILPRGSLDREAPPELADVMSGVAGVTPEGRLNITTGRLLGGTVEVEADGTPLIIRRAVGQGRVTFVAFKPEALQTAEDAGLHDFWHWLFPTEGWGPDTIGLSFAPVTEEIRSTLEQFGDQRPIRLVWIVVFIVSYVVVIGPVDYLVLKRLNRLEWTWFTFTAAVIVFSGIAYFGSVAIRGKQLSTRQIVLVDIDPASGWRTTTSYLGIHSPRNVELGFLGVSPDTSLSPLGHVETPGPTGAFGQDDTAHLQRDEVDALGALVRIWTPMSFEFKTASKDRPGKAAASITGRTLDLSFKNPFDQPLQDLLAVSDQHVFTLGSIAPGEERRWTQVQGRGLSEWISGQGLRINKNIWAGQYQPWGPRPTPRTLRNLCLYLTLAQDPPEWSSLQELFGNEGLPRPTVEMHGLNRRRWLRRGGLLVMGTLIQPPDAFERGNWKPAREEVIGFVRFAIELE